MAVAGHHIIISSALIAGALLFGQRYDYRTPAGDNAVYLIRVDCLLGKATHCVPTGNVRVTSGEGFGMRTVPWLTDFDCSPVTAPLLSRG